jgi:hypothetical protein
MNGAMGTLGLLTGGVQDFSARQQTISLLRLSKPELNLS